MRKGTWIVILLVLAAVTAGITLYSQNRGGTAETVVARGPSFRILVGVTDKESTKWDGSVKVSPGTIQLMRGWRFADGDAVENNSSWKASTRVAVGRKGVSQGMADNGVVMTVSSADPNTQVDVKTAQGNFSFKASEIGWGDEKPFLDGRVMVDRVPTVTQLTTTTEEQDFPAIAQNKDTVFVAY